MNKLKIYFASPFFRPDQIEREERCKKKLRDLGYFVFSPKENVVVDGSFDAEARQKAFKDNIDNIVDADMIFVVTDTKDIGTIWEAGFAYGVKLYRQNLPKIKVVYYCETLPEGAPFNLMLAQSGDIVITKFEDLDNLPAYIENGKTYDGNIQ